MFINIEESTVQIFKGFWGKVNIFNGLQKQSVPIKAPKRIFSDHVKFKVKIRQFNKGYPVAKLTPEEVVEKFGYETICYLTGAKVDLRKPQTYQFDHIIPRSRGGDNSINNLGISISEANKAKHSLTPEEFIELCRKVLAHNGYDVTKSTTQTLAEQDEYACFRD